MARRESSRKVVRESYRRRKYDCKIIGTRQKVETGQVYSIIRSQILAKLKIHTLKAKRSQDWFLPTAATEKKRKPKQTWLPVCYRLDNPPFFTACARAKARQTYRHTHTATGEETAHTRGGQKVRKEEKARKKWRATRV